MQLINIDFGELLTRPNSDDLGLFNIQFEAVAAHPLAYALNTVCEATDCVMNIHCCRADVDLSVDSSAYESDRNQRRGRKVRQYTTETARDRVLNLGERRRRVDRRKTVVRQCKPAAYDRQGTT